METTFWGSGRALLIYSSEWQLTREVSRLGSMLARVKLKGIDGSPHKRWSMWFNSMQHEEPYQGLTCHEGRRNFSVNFVNVNTGGAWLSSARDANCSVKSDNERNPRALFGLTPCRSRLLVRNQRKVRMMSSQHAPYALGYTRATMAKTKRCNGATPS